MLSDGPVAPDSLLLAQCVMAPSPFCRQQNDNSVFVSFTRQGRLIRAKPERAIVFHSSMLFVTHKQTHTHKHTEGSGNPLLWFVDIIDSVFHQLDQELSAQYRLAPFHITHYHYSSFHFPFGMHPLAKCMCVFISCLCNSFIF